MANLPRQYLLQLYRPQFSLPTTLMNRANSHGPTSKLATAIVLGVFPAVGLPLIAPQGQQHDGRYPPSPFSVLWCTRASAVNRRGPFSERMRVIRSCPRSVWCASEHVSWTRCSPGAILFTSLIRMACFQTCFVDAMQSRSHPFHFSASFSAGRGC